MIYLLFSCGFWSVSDDEFCVDGILLLFLTWSLIIYRNFSSALFSSGSVELIDCDDSCVAVSLV